MRFSLGLPVDRAEAPQEFQTAEAVMELAGAAEAHGFDAVFVTEHPVPELGWLRGGGHQALDPFVALSFAAAATRRIRLQTNLCVLPYRNPYLVAKSVASLDRLSGGRVLLGVGAGYLCEEFEALGADFGARNELCDRAIVEMKRIWTGEPIRIGAHQHQALPRPVQQPHPTLWGGGNSLRAIRRAVELCDGWMPFPNPRGAVERVRTPALTDLEELRKRIDYAREHAARIGRRAPLDVMFSAVGVGYYGQPGFSVQALIDQIGQQAELGVTQMGTLFEHTGRARVPSRARTLELMAGFAADVLAKVR
jgi:probable F420-dependent oxidoreductase